MSYKLRFATLVVLFASLARNADAQNGLPIKYSGKATTTAITAADALTRLYLFADDSMMGRRTGDIGGLRGTAYIEREVRRLGLVPGGDNGTFFQAVPIYTRTLDMTSKLSAGDDALSIGTDYVPLYPSGTPRKLDGAQIIYAGDMGDQSSLLSPEKVAGKIVAVTGTSAGLARRYPNAIAYILFRTDAALGQTRRFGMNPATLMRTDDDTVPAAFTIVVPNSASAKFLGVPG